jgi:hypothetical protein
MNIVNMEYNLRWLAAYQGHTTLDESIDLSGAVVDVNKMRLAAHSVFGVWLSVLAMLGCSASEQPPGRKARKQLSTAEPSFWLSDGTESPGTAQLDLNDQAHTAGTSTVANRLHLFTAYATEGAGVGFNLPVTPGTSIPRKFDVTEGGGVSVSRILVSEWPLNAKVELTELSRQRAVGSFQIHDAAGNDVLSGNFDAPMTIHCSNNTERVLMGSNGNVQEAEQDTKLASPFCKQAVATTLGD